MPRLPARRRLRPLRPAHPTVVLVVLTALVVVSAIVIAAVFWPTDDETDRSEQPRSAIIELPTGIERSRTEERSAFCRALLSLDDRTSSESLPSAKILVVYEQIIDDVPDEIRTEFMVVLEHLREDARISPDPDDRDADDRDADDPGVSDPLLEAQLLVAEYVEQECRQTVISPLPPPTEPGRSDTP